MDIEELKRLREAVEWYRDEALALSINLAGKNDQAVLAGVTALSLDAGQRGIKASVALQAIIARLEAAQAIQEGYALVRVEQVKDAERWQALLNCGRVKLQGWAGVDTKPGDLGHNDIGYVHFGAEFWTNAFEEKHYSAEAKAEAQKVLIAFADGAIKTAMLTAAAKGE